MKKPKSPKTQPEKKKRSPFRKTLNKLDPNFDNYIRMITIPPLLKMKDLKVQLKKVKKNRKKQKSK